MLRIAIDLPLTSSKSIEMELARSVAMKLTRAAFVPAIDDDFFCAAADEDDSFVLQPLLKAGVLIGAGRSSYDASRHVPMAMSFPENDTGMHAIEAVMEDAQVDAQGSAAADACNWVSCMPHCVSNPGQPANPRSKPTRSL